MNALQIQKIREIAATFLDNLGSPDSQGYSEAELRRSEYIKKFVDILAKLDYIPQANG